MHVEQTGDELIIRLSKQEAKQRGITAGDQVEVVKVDTIPHERLVALLDKVVSEHQGTIEYLKDK